MPRQDGERGGGRIRIHERNTNDSAATLGEDQDLPSDYNAILNETKKHKITADTKKDYRRRLKTIIQFWKEKLPEYYEVGVREVPDEINTRLFIQVLMQNIFSIFLAPSKLKRMGNYVMSAI